VVAPLDWIVHAFDEVSSTQTLLEKLARGGAAEGTVLTARHQREGRGRQGRLWWDAPGDALLFSALLRPSVPATRVPQLSLVAGLAVAEALEASAGVPARLRWPNDVLIQGRKVCGILPDAVSFGDGRVSHVLLGIGINVNQLEFPAELAAQATSLRLATGRRQDAAELLIPVLAALERRYVEWLDGGFAVLRDPWRQRAASPGQNVDDDGALLVETSGVRAGVVSRGSQEPTCCS
jgi:BirA family biotin operon repressor/biotin-[acetyl-CoA-carboxylase] ligase